MAVQSIFNVRNLTLVTGGNPATKLETAPPESGPFENWPFVSKAKIVNRNDYEGGTYADWCFWCAKTTEGVYENERIGTAYAEWLVCRMQWDDASSWDIEDVLPKIVEDQQRVMHDPHEADVIRAFWCAFGVSAMVALHKTRRDH